MTDLSNHKPLPRRWQIQHPIPREIDVALGDFSPLMRQLLYNRGIKDATHALAFLSAEVPYTTDPFLLKDMPAAVERLHKAICQDETIAIYGDYDADGVTASALMHEFLRVLGAAPRIYIPNRFDEGYGLNEEAIRQLAAEGVDLIITVDCGARAVHEVTLANELGVDVIITDHHAPGKDLPPTAALINPKQPGNTYPFRYLAGVGLAYKLTQAYLQTYPRPGVDPADWLDLVAIGTVADLAPLQEENRMLVRDGLIRIRKGTRPGLTALAGSAGLNLADCHTGMIGFGLGPRLNAAGRIDTALTAFELLTTHDYHRAGELAQKLDDQNSQRQEETQQIRELAAARVLEEDPEALLFFAADPAFNPGVVGLAASRLAEAYYRPAIIANQGEEFTVASCRSIKGFHITHALDECEHLLVRHGGHAAAAGFTVRNERVPELVQQLTAIAARELDGVALTPVIHIDRKIRLEKLNGRYISGIFNDLYQLEPTGQENPEPVFASFNLIVRHARPVGKGHAHLKMTLQAGDALYDAIAFQQGHWYQDMPDRIDIAYRFEENKYMGRVNLQLNVKDLRPATSSE